MRLLKRLVADYSPLLHGIILLPRNAFGTVYSERYIRQRYIRRLGLGVTSSSNLYVTILTLPNTSHIHCDCNFELAVAFIICIEIDILSFVILAMAMLLWTAYPGCPEHGKPELERRVRFLPSSFLLPPVAGELIVNGDRCQERLQGWALSQGFAIVRTSESLRQARPRFDFHYIHYREDTVNIYKLKKYIIR
jgi:hypothetical protein